MNLQQHVSRSSYIPNVLEKPRAIVQELQMRPSIIGRIRFGIQNLTFESQKNPLAVKIYEEGVEAGLKFDAIEREIQEVCKIKNPLKPENTEYLRITKSDFNDPESVQILLDKYGEDRGNGSGKRIYSLPILFPYDDPLKVMPHRFSNYTFSSLVYFSEYGNDGERYCMKYSTPKKSEVSTRLTRSFGGRAKEIRQDEYINGLCETEMCPEFQDRKCSLDLNLYFLIPGLQGAGVVQAHSVSTISLNQWYSTLMMVYKARGTLRNVKFSLTKKLMDVTFINKLGKTEKVEQFITVITSNIDIPELMMQSLEGIKNEAILIQDGNDASSVLQGKKPLDVVVTSNEKRNEQFERLQVYLKKVNESDCEELTKQVKVLKGYLFYLNVPLSDFEEYAIQKYGADWSKNIEQVKNAVNLVSISTEAELKHLLVSL